MPILGGEGGSLESEACKKNSSVNQRGVTKKNPKELRL